MYHTSSCPLNRELVLSPTPVVRLPPPTSRREVDAHNAKVVFRTDKHAVGYRTTKVNASEAAQMWGLVSPNTDFPQSPVQSHGAQVATSSPSRSRLPPTTPTRLRVPVATPSPSRSRPPPITPTHLCGISVPLSPLMAMDPAEAFARMGLGGDPSPAVEPRKQWAIAGVNQFFAERCGHRYIYQRYDN